ncbi:hypothetical protein N7447_008183 [Penicillium robsamsonii]|uniref:uncharacterized protein n=1 Tax=Penicillium robsamsonii TaxID=1792511 RepID=UPI002548DB6C|nr:uncharacterized protein N7447_008183 [Penicillium robsamsonii]KAJ5815950.1 hypothetical protein N7447_008183 [Penicillium robsamsonii]
MEDALRPSKEAFEYTLRASYQLWSTHFNTNDSCLPLECIKLKPLLKDTPAFCADELIPSDKVLSFACAKSRGKLEIKGKSRWRTSRAEARKVKLSKGAPLSQWPGVRGISGYDEGNYITVLFLAWAYILSAKWAELLDRSEMHYCSTKYSSTRQESDESVKPEVIAIDLPPDAAEVEIVWWNAILWNTSVRNIRGIRVRQICLAMSTTYNPPSSTKAFQYLIRFCNHHRIYAQCTSALSASFFTCDIFLRKPSILPIPKPANNPGYHSTPTSPQTISLISKHKKLLPDYMTLSSKMGITTIPAMKSIFVMGCGCHVLEYENWSWELWDGSRIEDTGVEARFGLLSSSTPATVSSCLSCPKPGLSLDSHIIKLGAPNVL